MCLEKQHFSSTLAPWLWKQIPNTLLLFPPPNQILTFNASQALLTFLSWVNFLVTLCLFTHGCFLLHKLLKALTERPSPSSSRCPVSFSPPINKGMPLILFSFIVSIGPSYFYYLSGQEFSLDVWWTFLIFLKIFDPLKEDCWAWPDRSAVTCLAFESQQRLVAWGLSTSVLMQWGG